MQSKREYAASLGLAVLGKRGRLSLAAHEAIAKAEKAGMKFSDENPVASKPKAEKPVKVSVKKSVTITVPKEDAAKVDPKVVRQWARDNGIPVGDRGRLHPDVIAQYLAGTDESERPERVALRPGEKDLRDSAPRRYPEGTTFEGSYMYKGEKHYMRVSTRSACMNCGVSLIVHSCDNPTVVTGVGGGGMLVTPIYPK